MLISMQKACSHCSENALGRGHSRASSRYCVTGCPANKQPPRVALSLWYPSTHASSRPRPPTRTVLFKRNGGKSSSWAHVFTNRLATQGALLMRLKLRYSQKPSVHASKHSKPRPQDAFCFINTCWTNCGFAKFPQSNNPQLESNKQSGTEYPKQSDRLTAKPHRTAVSTLIENPRLLNRLKSTTLSVSSSQKKIWLPLLSSTNTILT